MNTAHRERAAKALLLALAFGVTAWRLATPSIWFDEAASWENVSRGWGHLWMRLRAGADCGGYLYGALLLPWTSVFGHSELALRAPSVLAGVGFTALVMASAARLWGTRAALAAGTLAALHPEVVFWSRQSRAYAFVLLAAAGCAWGLSLLAGGRDRERLGLRVAAISSLALSGLHVFGVFFSAGLWAALALRLVPVSDAGRHRGLIGLALPFVTTALWALWMQTTIETRLEDFWLQSRYPTAIAAVFSWLMRPVWLVAPLAVLGLAWLARSGRDGRRIAAALALLGVAAAGLPVLASLASEGRHHYIHPRYALPLVPVVILAIASLAARLPSWASALGAAAIAGAAFAAGGTANLYRPNAPYGYDARAVAGFLAERLGPEDRVHVYAGHQALTLRYYGVGRPDAIRPGPLAPDATSAPPDRTWRVFWSRGPDPDLRRLGVDPGDLVRIGGMRVQPPAR